MSVRGDEDFLKDAKEAYKEATDGWRHIYDEARNDMKFVYDVDEGQWPASIRAERENDGRPVLTINKLQKFIRQLRGDQMLNRPRVKVIPVDDVADPPRAELYNGLIRQIEYLSSAEIAYDTAYAHAISCSTGFWRLTTEYEGPDTFNQDIRIKRIVNPFSVHYDPFATEFMLEDGKYCFVEELIDKKSYKKLYPGADVSDFDSSSVSQVFGDWMQGDKVRIAEYFYKVPVSQKIALLDNGEVVVLGGKDGLTPDMIRAAGLRIVRERTAETQKVMWCKMSGAEVLEETEWPGAYIPIIPVFGDEIVADGKKYYLSLARGAKGPQQMFNYWASAATETVALAPKMPFIVDHRQIKGFENEWDEAHRHNRMYIRYNAVAGLQKPSREPQAQIPTAIMAMLQQSSLDIEDHLGRYEAAKGAASNERSGKAIMARVQQSDKGTYSFVDNLQRAIIYSGRQLLDLIPKIYDTARALRVRGEDGQEQIVKINRPYLDENGREAVENDLRVGKYDLVASVGASYSSQRQEMVDFLLQTMQYAPQLAGIIAPLAIKASDYPGAQELFAAISAEIEKQAVMAQQQPTA